MMSYGGRNTSAHPEPEVEDAFQRLVDEGESRLERPLATLVSMRKA